MIITSTNTLVKTTNKYNFALLYQSTPLFVNPDKETISNYIEVLFEKMQLEKRFLKTKI